MDNAFDTFEREEDFDRPTGLITMPPLGGIQRMVSNIFLNNININSD
jgi:hypothetical protein